MTTITITISPKGETTIKTSGFSGSSCKDATRYFEQALGQTVTENLTTEYFETAGILSQTVQQN